MKRQYISPVTIIYGLISECELLTGTNVSISVPDTNVPGEGPSGFDGTPSEGGSGHDGLPPATAKGGDIWGDDDEGSSSTGGNLFSDW